MATTPGGPPNPNPAADRQTIDNLIEANRLQGDYGNILKSNITSLQKQLKEFEKINAKLETLEKTSINIREVNRELTKAAQKQYVSTQKITDLEGQLSKQKKKDVDSYIKAMASVDDLEEKIAKTRKDTTKAKYEAQLQKQYEIIQKGNEELNIDQLAYVAALKERDVNEEITKRLQEQLKVEKQIARQMGVSGNLVKAFAEKLGIGEQVYERMVLKAREVNKENEKLKGFKSVLATIGGAYRVAGAGIGAIAKEGINKLLDPASFIPIVGGLVKGLKTAFDFILGIQDQTVKFGRSLGLSSVEAGKIRNAFADINISNGDLLVNTEKLMASQTELAGLLGTENILTGEQLSTNIKLNELLGLDAQTRASIAQSSIITGRASENITKSVIAQVVGLKAATGVAFDYRQVLSEASKYGGYLGLQFAQFPGKIAKALITVKSFGLELKQLDGLASSFLDFESSIGKEFEAQVLLGRELNLTKAREAFLNNDLVTAAQEISKNAGDYLTFNKMNRIQQEGIAAAVGMNRDQLADMLKNQLYFDKLGTKATASASEQLKLAKQRFATEKEINAQLGEGTYQNLVTMSATEKIAAFIDKIRVAIGDFIQKSGIVDKLTTLFDKLSNPDNIRAVLMTMRDWAASLVHIMGVLVNGAAKIGNFFGVISDENLAATRDFFSNAENGIRSMGGAGEASNVNTGAVVNQKVPTSQEAAQGKVAAGATPMYNANYSFFLDGKPIYAMVREEQTKDQGNKFG